ncbi:MAG: 3-dehydroquinate synthase [Verrucomicrobiota bacterium]
MRTHSVTLPHHSYPVHIGPDLLSQISKLLPDHLGKTCALVSDTNVAPLYASRLIAHLKKAGLQAHLITIPAGESSKSMTVAEDVCRQMTQAGLDRHAFLIALGGGVVGDLAGFVAATFYRGISHVQIPTTIVSQVDSSVGGKTGVNTPEGKNLIGAFHQPAAVLADTSTLLSLPDREYREGFAEIIKHAAIRDRAMIPLIKEIAADRHHLDSLIERNVAIKAAIVAEDEKETTGTRALLNFGHTIGHAIESSAGYGYFLHGEAISLGLRAAAQISQKVSSLPTEDAALLNQLLDHFHLPRTLEADLTTNAILASLKTDKKFNTGKIRFILLRSFGDAFVSSKVTLEHITEAIESLRTNSESPKSAP